MLCALGLRLPGQRRCGFKGVIALSRALETNKAITTVDLCHNEISSRGAMALGRAFKLNTAMTKVYIDANEIGDTGARAIEHVLRCCNTAIAELMMAGNPASRDAISRVENFVRQRSDRKTLVPPPPPPPAGVSPGGGDGGGGGAPAGVGAGTGGPEACGAETGPRGAEPAAAAAAGAGGGGVAAAAAANSQACAALPKVAPAPAPAPARVPAAASWTVDEVVQWAADHKFGQCPAPTPCWEMGPCVCVCHREREREREKRGGCGPVCLATPMLAREPGPSPQSQNQCAQTPNHSFASVRISRLGICCTNRTCIGYTNLHWLH